MAMPSKFILLRETYVAQQCKRNSAAFSWQQW